MRTARGTTLPRTRIMAGARICICHRVRLIGECLERALTFHELPGQWIESGFLLQNAADLGENPFDLVLLGVDAPAGELADIVALAHRWGPACKLLLLVPDSATGGMAALTQLGSHGCVREGGSLAELCDAIRRVLGGHSYFSPELADALFAQLNGRGDERWAPFAQGTQLTSREQDVLRLIARENLSNKQIARRLHVSLYTVKNHVHNIIEKLEVSDRHGAAQLAQRKNLISAAAV
jgi:DNA-binding NarL/FixJ family response regulator